MNRQTISYLTQRFRERGFEPDSRHGQNFLVDLNLVELLCESAQLTDRDVVLEVGTGMGSLTVMMAREAAEVITVEIDEHLYLMAQEELAEFDNVTMLKQDALKNKNRISAGVLETIAEKMAVDPKRKFKLVANLPYNIATPLISNLLLCEHVPMSMTVTIQKELADRIVARPRSKDYSALSVWVQSLSDSRIVRVLPPGVFWPRPKVHSAIIQIVTSPKKRNRIRDLTAYHQFVRAIFLHRRKFLRSCILSAYKKILDKPTVDQVMESLELGPTCRAEELTVEQMIQLHEALEDARLASQQSL